MPIKTQHRNPFPLRCAHPGVYFEVVRMESNGTSAPDGADPTVGYTLDQTATGTYTVTFAERYKPRRIIAAWGYVEEDIDNERIVFGGYVASTGVATWLSYADDTAADVTTDKTMVLVMMCTMDKQNDA